MKISFILLLAALLSYAFQAFSGVYKEVDEQGNVTYSNVHSKDAQKVDLPPIITVPSVDSQGVDARFKKRRENNRIQERREELKQKIAEKSDQLAAIRAEYKDGNPDRLGSERNYQRYLDRVERLKKEISVREANLEALQLELQKLPEIK